MVTITGGIPTSITGHSLAKYWFDDAYNESKGTTWHHVRREITFSTNFLEAYLFEWAQSRLSDDISTLLSEFPQNKNIPTLTNKWKKVVKKVFEEKSISDIPESENEEFKKLVDIRGNLIHAKSSRLSISNSEDISFPVPSVEDLKQIKNGWATKTAIDLIHTLHQKEGTEIPEYMKTSHNRAYAK